MSAYPGFIFIGTDSNITEDRTLVKVQYRRAIPNPRIPVLLQNPKARDFDLLFINREGEEVNTFEISSALMNKIKEEFKNSFLFGRPHFSIKFFN